LVARVTRWVSLLEQEIPALPEHLSSLLVFCVVKSNVFCVVFCRSLFILLSLFIFRYCIVYPSAIPSSLTLWVRNPLRPGVLDITLCDKVCQWLATGWWFSSGTPVSSTNKTNRHDITEILLKVALNTITLTLTPFGDIRFLITPVVSLNFSVNY
jgi:hypothetical protein